MSVAVAPFTRTERLVLTVQLLIAMPILWIAELRWSLKQRRPRRESEKGLS